MNSVVSLRIFADASNVPIIVFVDPQQEHMGVPRLLETAGFNSALHHCRKVLAGESSLVSTPIDAFHRNHKVTSPCDASLCDASASHALEDAPADEFHRATSKVFGLYGDTFEADAWITSTTLPHKLGIRKNAGG